MIKVTEYIEFKKKNERIFVDKDTLNIFIQNNKNIVSFDISKLQKTELSEWVIFWNQVFKHKFGEL